MTKLSKWPAHSFARLHSQCIRSDEMTDVTTMPDSRQTAYTGVRQDVLAMVPEGVGTVLDIGCSDGTLGSALRREKGARHVTGVEIDPAFAERARGRIDQVICCDASSFDWTTFHNRRFDCII